MCASVSRGWWASSAVSLLDGLRFAARGADLKAPDRFYRESVSIPGYVLDLVVRLVNDTSRDVRAFVSVEWRSRPPLPPPHERADPIATFSRPPPPPPTTAPTQL
jgi:hypothetical protein